MNIAKGKRNIFILIDAETRKGEEDLIERLLKFEEVKEVHVISGQYDLLVVAEISLLGKTIFSTVQEISQILIRKVRTTEGVRDTNTIVPFLTAIK